MEKIKTEKADLESNRVLFVEIGLVVALAITLLAFEWKKYDIQKVEVDQRQDMNIVEEVVAQTEQKEKTPPPKETIQASTTILNVVKNNVNIETDILIDAEANENTQVEDYVPQTSNIKVEEEEVHEQEIFLIVEKQPEFPGGQEALMKYIRDNIKYPQLAKETGIEGVVYVTFVVEPDGSVDNVEVVRHLGGGCDEEAIRIVKSMPRWTPGSQRGRNVRVRFSLPFKFTLQKSA